MVAKHYALHVGPYEPVLVTDAGKNPDKLVIRLGDIDNRQVIAISGLICEALDQKYKITDTLVTPETKSGAKKITVLVTSDTLSLADVIETVEDTLAKLHHTLNTRDAKKPNFTAAIKQISDHILFGTEERPLLPDVRDPGFYLRASHLSKGMLADLIVSAIPDKIRSGAADVSEELAAAIARNLKLAYTRQEKRQLASGSTHEEIATARVRGTLDRHGCEEHLAAYLTGEIIDMLKETSLGKAARQQSRGRE